MNNNRVLNTKRNVFSGIIYKFISLVLPFLIRTAILYELGDQYVGLSSLFTSILQVLNLAELGFSSAIIFNMYKPIAEKRTEEVCALLNYYRKVYYIIGSVIFVVGICLLPVLPYLVKGSWPSEINIYFLYLLYLMNVSISYFLFAYKSALLNAMQRMDILNIVQSVVFSLKYIFQLVVLVCLKNYYAFVIVAIVSTVVFNLVTALISKNKYPIYFCKGSIPRERRRDVRKQVGGLMISKVCDTSRNSLDSVILSVLFGLTTVAIYNNYYYIFSAVYGILLIITQAMQASVGNSIVVESKQKNYQDLQKFQFIFSGISIVATACMMSLYQPFMRIWVGTELMLSNGNMILYCIYFYIINMNNMRNLYFQGTGLWWNAKRTYVAETMGNLLLNIILGYFLGITGVLLATIITILLFNFIARTTILFNKYFNFSVKGFFSLHIQFALICMIVCIVCYEITSIIVIRNCYLELCVRCIVCLLISIFLLFIILRKYQLYTVVLEFLLKKR